MLGAVLPGSGFVAAGRRLLGFAVLTVVGIAVMLAAGVLVVEHRPAALAAELASRPGLLRAAAVAVLVGAALWVTIIVATHFSVRGSSRPAWQQTIGLLLTLSLCAGVAYGSVWSARAALATHSLVETVFSETPVDAAGTPIPVDREDPWDGRPRINVLLLGGDAGEDRTGLRTDSVLLASVNTVTGDTVLFSLPRNLEDVPFRRGSPLDDVWPNGFDCGYENGCTLNAVYEQGHQHADRFPGAVVDPGVAAVSDAVSATLGLDVDFFLMVDLGGFERLVDALGGIDIDVGDERVPMGGTDIGGNDQPEWAIEEWIEPGFQHLDGREALWFARSRWRSDDYERMERQRCVLNAAVEQASPGGLLTNYLELAATAEDIITTDVPHQLFPAFLELADKVQSTPLRTLPFTDDVITSGDPNFRQIRALVRAALDPPRSTTPATSAPTTPPTSGSTTSPPAPDPTQAVEADAVCG